MTSNIRPSLIAELRRRRVFRTLALYVVGAWVLMQVADVVLPALDLPEQAIRYLLLAAAAGFPVARRPQRLGTTMAAPLSNAPILFCWALLRRCWDSFSTVP